jgi:outer membrane usher protein
MWRRDDHEIRVGFGGAPQRDAVRPPRRAAGCLSGLILLWLLACVAYPVRADDDAAVQRAPLQLFVNEVEKGPVVVLMRGAELLVAVDDLRQAGLTAIGGTPETIAGKPYLALATLAPRVTYVFDQDNLVLRLTVDPALLTPSRIDLQPQFAPPNLVYRSDPGGFVNYALTGQRSLGTNAYTAFTEQGASLWGGFFDNSLTDATGSKLTRSSTSFTMDDRTDLTRLVIGDSIAALGALGGTSPLGGISYSTQFAVNPYFVPFPGQTFAGIVNTPSTADIYVNGQLVRTINLPPGPFNLQNLPVSQGAGVTRVVIRNAFGQTQELGAPFYQSTALLKEGLQQFTYNLGMEHDLSASGFGHYVRPAFLASHAFGLTDQLTPGVFVEGDRHVVAGGPSLTLGSDLLGQLAVLAAGSRDSVAGAGWSSSLEYSYQTLGLGTGIDLTYTSSRYATISVPVGSDRPQALATGFFSVPFGLFDVTAQYTHEHLRDAGRSDQASLTGTYQLFDRVGVAATVAQNRVIGQPVDTSIFLSFNIALGDLTTGTLSVNHSNGVQQETAQVQQSLPLGPGWGYRAQLQGGQHATQIGDVQYQGQYGLYEAEYDHLARQDLERVSASGGVVAVGGDVYATRAVNDSFALIRVADVPGVDVRLNGQKMGKTNDDGELLVPNMTSYLASRLAIDDQQIPADYVIDGTERVVATGFRGAAIVAFPVHRQQALVGNVVIDTGGKPVVPAYGDLTVSAAGKDFTSPIGAAGEFYLDGVPPGDHPATVSYTDGDCRFTLNAPATKERMVKLGLLTCRP